MSEDPHSQPAEAVLNAQESHRDGLTAAEASSRREQFGENELVQAAGRSIGDILVAQFDSVLIWVLLVAAGLSIWAGHAIDAVLIAIIVLANGLFGFAQDYQAEQSLESLRSLAAPTATVRRNGEDKEVEATQLVPGDIVVLAGGDVVPADGRLIEATDLEADEAALTGESVPASKTADPVAPDTPLADRSSMVYKGTNVTRGKGLAVITDTGMNTEVGAIAQELASAEETETPLQAELDRLGRTLGFGVLVLSAIVVPVLLLQETDFVQAGLTAVSLAVAAIPEGLPAVVTLTLALGVRKMSEENALVRRLPAVEALGSVDVICTDKTGTLTRGEMTVEQYWTHDSVAEVDADADATDLNDRETRLLEIAAVCNDATSEEGDPTEQALVEAAVVHGFDVDGLRSDRPRTDEVPFSSERKWMGTIHDDVGYVKGAPEVVLANADQLLTEEGPRELTDADRTRIEGLVEAFADDALRVLAMAYHESPASGEDLGDGLVFVGLMGMIDPPREEVADAIATTRRAGIDVKMVTGDNGQTARAIAESIGLGTEVRTGPEIEAMTDEELREHVEAIDVFARTSPEHKVRILEALQDCGHRVAMTGDGVNDAPALKNADVGVAMGIRGTDVAKQASDIVLLDDNYTTIERAVERGRGIFDNVWKFVAYLLSANVAEVAIVFIASLYGYLILPAVQLLWINLLTDGLPALALGADPGSKDVMERSPRSPDQGIVGRPMLEFIGGAGVVTTIVVLGLMFLTLDGRPESIESVLSLDAFGGAVSATDYAVTMVFTAFVVLEFGKLAVIRWLRGTRFFTNPWLGVAILASFLLQLAVLYTPLSRYFDTVGLWLLDWGLIAGVGAICLPAYLLVATVVRRRIE